MIAPPLIDAHCHLVRHDLSDGNLGELLREMDDAGVRAAYGLGLPFDLEESHPPRYTDLSDKSVQAMALAAPARIVPFVCGFDPRDPTSLAYVERALGDGAKGVGELLLRYDGSLGRELAQPVDHPLLLEVYRLAGQARVPVLFHATVRYLDEIERAIERSPDTTFLWAHAGVSWEFSGDSSGLVRRLVSRHPRLSADISWILWDYQLLDPSRREFRRSWLDLFEEFPDRFLVGFDLVGEYHETRESAAKYRALLERLTPEAAVKLGSENARALVACAP